MKPLRVDVILALFLLSVSLAACGRSNDNADSNATSNVSNANNENTNTPKTNVEELGMLINIRYVSEDTVWKESASQKELTAVLRFSNVDCVKIAADAEKYRKPESVTIENESWFPDDLIAQGEMSGDDTLKGTSYAANAFLQEPFNDGRIIRIEGTNYFVLEATSK